MMNFLNHLDRLISIGIQRNFHNPVLDEVMNVVTSAGDKGLVWVIISTSTLVNRHTRHIGTMTIGALVLSTICGEGILKNIVRRPRPYDEFPTIQIMIDKSTKYSFPSGHTTSSFAAAFILSKYLKKYSLPIWITAITIAFSRLYLCIT